MLCAIFGLFGWLLALKGLSFFLVLDYENYHPKGKEAPKGDGNKSDTKRKLPSFSCASLVCVEDCDYAVKLVRLVTFDALVPNGLSECV